MRIARAGPADAAALTKVAFAAKGHWGYPPHWLESWRGVLTLTPDYVRAHPTYGAFTEEGIAGFYALQLDPPAAVLDHLWVTPGQARQGIGASLFRHCEATARAAGASLLRIEADPHAEGFYLAMGARTVGRAPAPMDGVERFLPLMEKRLVSGR